MPCPVTYTQYLFCGIVFSWNHFFWLRDERTNFDKPCLTEPTLSNSPVRTESKLEMHYLSVLSITTHKRILFAQIWIDHTQQHMQWSLMWFIHVLHAPEQQILAIINKFISEWWMRLHCESKPYELWKHQHKNQNNLIWEKSEQVTTVTPSSPDT